MASLSSVTVVSYFNGKYERVCDFHVDPYASAQEKLDLARDTIAQRTYLPARLLTLKLTPGYVHILDRSVPKRDVEVSQEIERCQLTRKFPGYNGLTDLASLRERAKAGEIWDTEVTSVVKKVKESKTKEPTST